MATRARHQGLPWHRWGHARRGAEDEEKNGGAGVQHCLPTSSLFNPSTRGECSGASNRSAIYGYDRETSESSKRRRRAAGRGPPLRNRAPATTRAHSFLLTNCQLCNPSLNIFNLESNTVHFYLDRLIWSPTSYMWKAIRN